MVNLLLTAILFLQTQAPVGTISGQIIRVDGKPAVGVRVRAVTPSDNSVSVGMTQTDREGRYKLENLLPGRYFVAAGTMNIPSYYPGVWMLTTATAVSAAAGTDTPNINFKLAPPGVTIRGHVSGLEKLSPDARRAIEVNPVVVGATASRVDSKGRFEIRDVPPGSYPITLSPRVPNREIVNVVVESKDVEGIDLTAPNVIVGRIRMEDGRPLPVLFAYPGIPPVNRASPYPAANCNGVRVSGGGTVSLDGSFAMALPEGDCRFEVFALPVGHYVKSMTYGGIDVLRKPLRYQSSVSSALLVTLTSIPPAGAPKGVTVRGQLTGIPADSSWGKVALMFRAQSSGAGGFSYLTVKEFPADGAFEFQHVMPGSWNLQVISEHTAGPYFTLPVKDTDLTNVVVPVLAGFNVSGSLTMTGNGSQEELVLTLQQGESVIIRLPVSPNGSFSDRTRIPEGEYVVSLERKVADLPGNRGERGRGLYVPTGLRITGVSADGKTLSGNSSVKIDRTLPAKLNLEVTAEASRAR